MQQRELVLLTILVAQVTPIAGLMPTNVVKRLFSGLLESSESAGRGDDLTETELDWQSGYALFFGTAAV